MRPRTTVSVFTWFTASLMAFVLVSPGRALAQEVPFTGIVNQSQTDVRAGAADRFYRVGELDRGQLVKVNEVISGWNKVVPPQGVYSYISKAFVDAKGDGSVGVVNTDASKVYAADVNGPAGSYRVQVLLNEGDGVQIVVEEGSHYKIVAPVGAYVYLPPGSIRRALAMEAAVAEEPAPAQPQPSESVDPEPAPKPDPLAEPVVVETPAPTAAPSIPAQPKPTVATIDPATDSTSAPADDTSVQTLTDLLDGAMIAQTQPAVQAVTLIELEREMASLFTLDIEEQPLDEMISKYQVIQDDPDLSTSDRQIVEARLAVLHHNKQIAEGLAAITEARQSIKFEDQAPPQAPQVDYDATGRLLASSVYDGKTLPRMYRLVDPATGRAVAYLRPTDTVNTTQYLGQLVGVKGPRADDPTLKLRIIQVKQIDVLEPASD